MKTLICAANVKERALSGTKIIEFSKKEFIVTPEAFEVAKELGVDLVDKDIVSARVQKDHFSCGVKPNLFPLTSPILTPVGETVSAEQLKQIRLAVIAQLPSGSIPEALIDQIVMKVIKEKQAAPASSGTGVKCIDHTTIKLAPFPGQPPVGIADAITAEHGSPMASGFMAWENHAFPWHLDYDEVSYIIEGELHLRCGGELTVARAGDSLYIPKGSSVEFGTPTKVKFFYVTFPANWQG